MRDAIPSGTDIDALDREAEAAASEFGVVYPRAASQIFGLLARLDHLDSEIVRANAFRTDGRPLPSASARIRVRADVRHARALWSSAIAAIPFTPPARRRA